MKQLRLPNAEPPQALRPSADRAMPGFWVRRIAIVRELAPGAEHVVRDVSLRRGLNIIWTEPVLAESSGRLFQSGMAGHTAGKTTFCRCVRYVLGEKWVSTERTRRRLREKFPTGWVLAEVMIGGERWAVARPLASGPHSFCMRGCTIENLVDSGAREKYQEFLNAISAVTVDVLASNKFPSSDELLRWEHLMPWLSRDQECRFMDFAEWRHRSSESEAPALTADERQFIIRSVLGLISDSERAEQLRNAQLVSAKKEAALRAPLLAHQATVDSERLAAAIPDSAGSVSLQLFASSIRSSLRQQLEDIERELVTAAAAEDLGAVRDAVDDAIQRETNARRDVEEAESRLLAERGALARLTTPDAPLSLLASLPPSRGYCNQPMSVAREHGCPLATTLPEDLVAKRSQRVARDNVVVLQKLVADLETVVTAKKRALAESESRRAASVKADMIARTRADERRAKLYDERSRLKYLQRQLDDAERAEVSARRERDLVDSLSREIDASYALQEQLRAEGKARLGQLASTFDYVVRAILGDEVSATVAASGRALALSIDHNGERESAAIATVKLLAFDLAALTESVQGRGFFPRFLVHDGPREADLAPDIYARLFLFVRGLEECFPDEPSFQYIVTTTTRPPEEVLRAPWLRLTLAGVPAEERLLRCDL